MHKYDLELIAYIGNEILNIIEFVCCSVNVFAIIIL